jgi:hypothetical protein
MLVYYSIFFMLHTIYGANVRFALLERGNTNAEVAVIGRFATGGGFCQVRNEKKEKEGTRPIMPEQPTLLP